MWRSLKISQEAAMQQLLCIDSFKGQVELYVAPNHPLLSYIVLFSFSVQPS